MADALVAVFQFPALDIWLSQVKVFVVPLKVNTFHHSSEPLPEAPEMPSVWMSPVLSYAFSRLAAPYPIDIEEVVDRIGGRACVLGNLDAITLLEHASEAALRAEIGRQIRAGRRNGSRFIMSIGSPVTPRTSTERVRRCCEIARDLGRA